MTLLYRCDGCGDVKDYLSQSWSTVTIIHELGIQTPTFGQIAEDDKTEVFHFCLACRSEKKEWPRRDAAE